jgi:hypothetical protein
MLLELGRNVFEGARSERLDIAERRRAPRGHCDIPA